MKNIRFESTYHTNFINFILILVCFSSFLNLKGNDMERVDEPLLSIDKITVLVNCLVLSNDEYNRYLHEDIELELNQKLNLVDRCKLLSEIIEYNALTLLEPNFQQDLGSTENYLHHFRLLGGIDLQYGVKRKIKNKIGEIEFHGPWWENQAPRMKPVYEYHFSEYGIRLEFNPNKVSDYRALERFINFVKKMNPFSNDLLRKNELIKVTRIDLACDYPDKIDPMMFTSRCRKMSFFAGSEGIETVYFGTRRSEKQLRVYNKKQELTDNNQHCNNENLWRLELAYTKTFMIDDLDIYNDPFIHVKYYDYNIIKRDFELSARDELIFVGAVNQGNGISFGVDQVINSISSWTPRNKRRIKQEFKDKYTDLAGSITSPSTLYNEQFKPLWDSFKTHFKGMFI